MRLNKVDFGQYPDYANPEDDGGKKELNMKKFLFGVDMQ